MKRTLALFIFTTLLAPCALASKQYAIQPEVLIAEGMPVVLNVSFDEKEREMIQYKIRRTVGPDVNEVTMILFTVGHDNKFNPKKLWEATSAKGAEKSSHAWERNADVSRFLVIVKSVQTADGMWVLDTQDLEADLKAFIEQGQALPKAKFVKQV